MVQMKKLLPIFLLLVLGISACKKDDVDAATSMDWSTIVDGTYAFTQVTSGGTVVTYPSNGNTGQIIFTRTANSQSTMRIVVSAGSNALYDQSTTVYLTGSGSSVDIYADANHTTKFGTATKNLVNLSSNSVGTITAAR
jgi:hypothetical protein